MKILLLLLLICCCVGSWQATAKCQLPFCADQCHSIDCIDNDWKQVRWIPNWLVGISGGYAGRHGGLMTNGHYSSLPLEPNFVDSTSISDSGFIWGVLVGYQAVKQQWLLGLEFNVDRHAIDGDHQFSFVDTNRIYGWAGQARYQRRLMAGLTMRVAYALQNNFMPYLRAGAELGDDRLITSFSAPLLSGTPANNEQLIWVYRFLLGAGVEFPLVPACGTTLRLEYNFHSKGKTVKNFAAIYDGVVIPGIASQLQPYTRSMRLAVIWNFF